MGEVRGMEEKRMETGMVEGEWVSRPAGPGKF